MPKYHAKFDPDTTLVYNAERWFKNGDHSKDDVFRPFEDTGLVPTEPREGKFVRYYRRPDVDGKAICPKCKHPYDQHGWIDYSFVVGETVCPGSWIIEASGISFVHTNDMFEAGWEPIPEVKR